MPISTRPGETYSKLGKKTFFLFVLARSGLFFILFLIFAAVLASIFFAPEFYKVLPPIVLPMGALILAIVALGTFEIGWLEYAHYSIFIGEEDMEIRRGIINEEEIGIPYRRIRDVKIERDVMDQILGVSNVIITVSGEESAKDFDITMPAIERDLAEHLQDSILNKAQIEEMKMNHAS